MNEHESRNYFDKVHGKSKYFTMNRPRKFLLLLAFFFLIGLVSYHLKLSITHNAESGWYKINGTRFNDYTVYSVKLKESIVWWVLYGLGLFISMWLFWGNPAQQGNAAGTP